MMFMRIQDNESDAAGLNQLLRESKPNPGLPPRFQEAVWRRIEQADLAVVPGVQLSWLDRLVAMIVRPRLVVAGAIAVLLLGGIVGVMDGATEAKQEAFHRYVASVAPEAVR